MGIAVERQLAVTLRLFEQAAEPIDVGEREMRLGARAEMVHQPAGFGIGAFEVVGFGALESRAISRQ